MRGTKNLGLFLSVAFILLSISVSAAYSQDGQPPSLILFNPEIQGLTVTINGVTMPGTPGAIITRIHWDWGDGIREDQWFAASHTYSYPGTYTVTVTSFQSDGLSTTRSVTVTLTAGQPPSQIPTDLTISLEPSVAEANRDTRVIVRGVLTRRDTGQGLAGKMILVHPRFPYAQPPTVNVVTDGRGYFQADFIVNAPTGVYYFTAAFGGDSQFDYSDARAALTVQQPRGQPPSLTLFEPEIRGLTVTVNGVTMPGTPGATIIRIQWDWGDGYREDRWFAASHTYSRPGTYTITVTSFQSDGLSTTRSVTVTLQPQGQPPSLTLFNPEIQGLTVTINGVTMPGTPGATITRIHWDWGDGSREDRWFAASHTYSRPGTYTVTVTAFQSDGLSTTKTVSVTVEVRELPIVKFRGIVVQCPGVSYEYCVKITQILDDPTGYHYVGEVVGLLIDRSGSPHIERVGLGDQVEVLGKQYWEHKNLIELKKPHHYIKKLSQGVQGSLGILDIDYRGTPPNSDGNDQRSVTVPPGTTLTLFFKYNEGNANNQYIVRVYPEWDKNRHIANSDNDETIPEVGQEIGGYRWDRETFSAPTAPGTYKVRVVYSASATPPSWDRYDRLLAEGTVVVEQRIGTELSISLEPNTAPENKETTVLVKGILLRRDNRQGIANKPIFVSFRGQQRTVTTDSRGSFQAEFKVNVPAGSYPFTASFAGDSQFEPSTATATLTVLRLEFLIPTKLTLEIDRTSIQADTLETVRFSGKLTRADTGQGLAGKTVYITIPGESVPVPVTTDAAGVYGLVYGIKVLAGTYKVEARYQGETVDNTRYEASSATATLTAKPAAVQVKIMISGLPPELTTRIYIDDKHECDMRGGETLTIKLDFTHSHVISADKLIIQSEFSRFMLSNDRVVLTKPQDVTFVYNAEYKLIQVKVIDGEIVDKSESWHQAGSEVPIVIKESASPAIFLLAIPVGLTIKGIGTTLVIGVASIAIVSVTTTLISMNQAAILSTAYVNPGYISMVTDSVKSPIKDSFRPEDIKKYIEEAARGRINYEIEIEYRIKGVKKSIKLRRNLQKLQECIKKPTEDEVIKCIREWIKSEVNQDLLKVIAKEASGIDKLPAEKRSVPEAAAEKAAALLAEEISKKLTDEEIRQLIYEKNRKNVFDSISSAVHDIINSFLNWIKENVCKFIEWILRRPCRRLVFSATCPVDLIVTDPDGLVIDKRSSQIPGATYTEIDLNGDGDPDDQIVIPNRKIGDYQVRVIPEPRAKPTDTYTLVATIDERTEVLAREQQIKDIPSVPYVVVSEKESLSTEEAVAAHSGDPTLIEDADILWALQLWISGEEVPGTDGKVIDDAMMLKLLGLWTSRKPVSQASGASYQSIDAVKLSVNKIALAPNPVKGPGVVTLKAKGTGIAGLKVEVFNLAGMKVLEQEAAGDTMRFYAVNNRGQPLANGVYLYTVTVKGFDGRTERSRIEKLVILR